MSSPANLGLTSVPAETRKLPAADLVRNALIGHSLRTALLRIRGSDSDVIRRCIGRERGRRGTLPHKDEPISHCHCLSF